MTRDSTTVDTLLDAAGRTYADQAGITLRDKPAPLYRLLVLAVLLSTRIRADIAVDAARELVRSGMGTPTRMREASWQDRVDALGAFLNDRLAADVERASGDKSLLIDAVLAPRGISPLWCDAIESAGPYGAGWPAPRVATGPVRIVGADIFCREAQDVWPELRPALDGKARQGAQRLNLPTDPHRLARLVADNDLGRLAAALTRAALDADVRRAVLRDR